ncbi:g360 [Coccomyxa elongata]
MVRAVKWFRSLASSDTNTEPGTESVVATGPGGDSDDLSDLERTRQQLSRVFETTSISGEELRELIVEKWGRSYDTRLHKRGRRMYLQIMWKFLEQRSFHMNELEYQAQLDAVAEYLTLWRVGPTVRAAIRSAPPRGPGYTGGGGARAVSIPLDVELDGARSGEWDSF